MPDEKVKVVFEGIDKLSGVAKGVGAALLGVGAAVATLSVAAVGAGARFIKSAVDDTQEYVLAVNDLAQAFKLTSEDASIVYNLADDFRVQLPAIEMAFKRMAQNGIQPSIAGLQKLADKYNAIKDPAKQAKFLVDNFGRSGLDMSRILDLGSAGIAAFAAALDEGLVVTDKNRDAVLAYFASLDNLQDTVLAAKVTIGSMFIPVISQLADTISALVTRYQPQIEAFFEAIAFKAEHAVAIIEGLLTGNLAQLIHGLQNTIGPEATEALLAFFQGIEDFGNWAGSPAGKASIGILEGILVTIGGFLGVQWVVGLFAGLGAAIGVASGTILALVVALGVLLALIFNFGNVRGWLGELGAQWTADAQKWIIDTVLNISNRLAVLYVDFYNAGKKIFEGLRKGITEKFGEIQNEVERFIKDMLRKIRNALGIHSPSSVFFDIGQNMMAGMQEGIRSGMKAPQMSLAYATAPGGGAAVQTTGDGNINELRAIRDEIRWLVRKLPTELRDVLIVER